MYVKKFLNNQSAIDIARLRSINDRNEGIINKSQPYYLSCDGKKIIYLYLNIYTVCTTRTKK